MHKRLLAFLFLFVLPYHLWSQVFPKEGAKLHYRLVPFVFQKAKPGSNYKIEVAAGNYNSIDSFKNNVIKTIPAANNRMLIEVPEFGKMYTWRVVSVSSTIIAGDLHHFSTLSAKCVDSSNVRFRILKNAEQYKDAYVFLDGTKVLYDMKGHPIWFLPDIDGERMSPRDIKITTQGTITLLNSSKALEINYNGDVLWRGPDNDIDSVAAYHHEFTKLNNGHYMVLGKEMVWVVVHSNDTGLLVNSGYNIKMGDNNKLYEHVEFGTVLEYDSGGKLVWSWSSANYYQHSDVMAHRKPNGIFDVDVHENSFFFDSVNKVVYLSFRNVSRILKVKYPEGKLLNAYGNKYDPKSPEMGNELYCFQHSCGRTQSGDLCVFNNNDCNLPEVPRIIIMKEPTVKSGKLEKIWEFECKVDKSLSLVPTRRSRPGGNIIELPDHSLFASASCAFTAVFIVNKEKKVTWCGVPEFWQPKDNSWRAEYQYRASIIKSRKELETLIWNSVKM